MKTKKCITCNIEKDIDLFGNNKNSKDLKHPYCKDCENKRQRKRYEKIIEGMRVDFNKKLLDADLKMRIKYGQEREEGND